MSRKKQQTLGDMARLMAEMQQKMTAERERMAGVMASALLDDKGVTILGDFSDADLRRVMALLSAHLEDCANKVKAEKKARQQAAQKPQEAAPAPAPVPPQQVGYQQGPGYVQG